jgi:TusA-related sulfurtransferase
MAVSSRFHGKSPGNTGDRDGDRQGRAPRRVASGDILPFSTAPQCRLRSAPEIDRMQSLTNQENRPPRDLDITAETCPMTFVLVRLELDRMAPGQELRVVLKGEEPLRNVPRTATEQGHAVLEQESRPDGTTLLRIRKKM